MILKKISYINMRNLENTTIIPSDNINVFTGEMLKERLISLSVFIYAVLVAATELIKMKSL